MRKQIRIDRAAKTGARQLSMAALAHVTGGSAVPVVPTTTVVVEKLGPD